MKQGDQERQKILQPPEQEGEVVAGGGQDGVEGVALLAGEVVAGHSVFALDMADDGLDRRPPPHLALDGWGDAALLAGGEDPELVALRCVVAAIAGVGEDAADLGADGLFHVGDDACQRVAVIGITGQCFCMQGELATLGALQRGGHRHLHPELVGHMRLALADAFYLVCMQAVDLAAALALALLENGGRLVERPFEERVQPRIADDLATDVANGPAKLGLEPAQRLVRPLELLGVGIALMADQRQLARLPG